MYYFKTDTYYINVCKSGACFLSPYKVQLFVSPIIFIAVYIFIVNIYLYLGLILICLLFWISVY